MRSVPVFQVNNNIVSLHACVYVQLTAYARTRCTSVCATSWTVAEISEDHHSVGDSFPAGMSVRFRRFNRLAF